MALNIENQPDWTAAAHALRTAGDELIKCPNMPAIREGNAILTAIHDMERRIQTQLQGLSTQQQALSTQFQNLSIRQQASDYNSIARLTNRSLQSPDEDLMCLRDPNNNLIPGFPATPAMIRQLRVSQLDGIFQALGMESTGTIGQKQARLRLVIGMRPIVA